MRGPNSIGIFIIQRNLSIKRLETFFCLLNGMDDKNSSFLLKQSIQRSHHCIHKYKLPANLLILETINLYIRLFLCSHLSASFNFHHPAMMIIWLLVIGCIYTWLDTSCLWYSLFGLENCLGIPGGKARVGDEEWSFLWNNALFTNFFFSNTLIPAS